MPQMNIAIIAPTDLTRNGLVHIIKLSKLKHDNIFSYSCLSQFLQESQKYSYRITIIEDHPYHHQTTLIEQVQTLVHEFPAMKIIVLSALRHEPYVQRVMECGIHGYLTLDENIEVVLPEAINMILSGQIYLSASLSLSDMPLETLNRSDIDVLRLMYKGCNNFELRDHLDLTERSIYRIRGRLRSFLNVGTNDQILLAAYQQGWLD